MTIEAWLRATFAVADQRGLPELKPLLENLALATGALRAANFTGDADGTLPASASADPAHRSAVRPPGRPSR